MLNACRAMNHDGRTCVSARVDKGQLAERSWISITVEDDGPGLSPHTAERLFSAAHRPKPGSPERARADQRCSGPGSSGRPPFQPPLSFGWCCHGALAAGAEHIAAFGNLAHCHARAPLVLGGNRVQRAGPHCGLAERTSMRRPPGAAPGVSISMRSTPSPKDAAAVSTLAPSGRCTVRQKLP